MKESQLRRAFMSIIKPYSLTFKDIIEEVGEISKTIDELALAASRAEIRNMHLQLAKMQAETQALVNGMAVFTENFTLPSSSGSAQDAKSFRSSFSLHAQISLGKDSAFVSLKEK